LKDLKGGHRHRYSPSFCPPRRGHHDPRKLLDSCRGISERRGVTRLEILTEAAERVFDEAGFVREERIAARLAGIDDVYEPESCSRKRPCGGRRLSIRAIFSTCMEPPHPS